MSATVNENIKSSTFQASDLGRLEIPTAPAVRPGGTAVAYVLQRADAHSDSTHSAIWWIGTERLDEQTPEPRRLTSGPADSEPVWFPDGASLSFLRSTDGEAAQLWRIAVTGGEAEQLTSAKDFPHGVTRPTIAPDGATLYFAAAIPIEAERKDNAPITTDSLAYKADGAGNFGALRQHLFSLQLGDRTLRQLTDGDWHAGESALSADGRKLAFVAARGENYDLDMSSHAWYIDLQDPSLQVQRIGQAAAVQGALLWDGDSVLAVAQQETRIGNAGLWRLFLDQRPDQELSAGLDRNVMFGGIGYPGGRPQLGTEGEIYFCVREGGNTNLLRWEKTGEISAVLEEPHQVVAGLSHDSGMSAVILINQNSFGEIAVVTAGQLYRLTTHTANSLPDVELIKAEPREFAVADGQQVHGWLIRAASTEGAAPTLLDVHGGPHNAWTGVADTMHPYHQSLAAVGWNVLILNPRGSDGYGEDFMRAVWDSWGEADHQDFLQPIDTLIAEGLVDPERLAVTGYSYGGFTVCDLTTRTKRFAAAIAGGLVCDLRHFPGASDLGVYLGRIELAAADDERRAAELSPITRVNSVSTPTLVLHGAMDERCPANQAEQWFAALRLRGVDTSMVLYPGQSHAFPLNGPLSHRIDYSARLIDWLQRHIGDTQSGRHKRYSSDAVPVFNRAYWQHRLDVIRTKYQLPGAVFGILQLDRASEPESFASGFTSIETGIETTGDTLVQIGSITKTYTATLIMQLVEEGLLDLDAPIRDVLPDFTVSDPVASRTITMRQLLTHTSGLDGDIFTDTGRGDDCVQRYVESLVGAEQLFTPGETWSYCNTGFVIAGRAIEVLRGKIWDEVLHEHIFKPLELNDSTTLVEQTALHRYAVGHLGLDQEQKLTPVFDITRSMGPAGLISATANDVLRYARAVITADQKLLSADSWAELTKAQVDVSVACPIAENWALGWCLPKWGNQRCINHNGTTFGQNSFLHIFPEAGVALFLSVNGGRATEAFRELFSEAALHFAGAEFPADFVPDGKGDGLQAMAGEYQAAGSRLQLQQGEQGWKIVQNDTSGMVNDGEQNDFELKGDSSGRFGARTGPHELWSRCSIETVARGLLLHFGARAYPARNVAQHD